MLCNANDYTGLWERFEQNLVEQALYHIIIAGRPLVQPEKKVLTVEQARIIIDRFKQASQNFMGANRSMAMSPYFALALAPDGQHASLLEYISYDYTDEQVSRDMNWLAAFCFWHIKTLKILSIPLKITVWSDDAFKVAFDAKTGMSQISPNSV